jgi:hypothetical protein
VSLIMTVAKTQRRMQSYRSPALRLAAARFRGDPGIFDSIWSGIKGAAGGFLSGGIGGAILGGAAGIASGNKGKPVNPAALGGGKFAGLLPARLTAPGDTRIFSPGGDITVGSLPPMLSEPGRGNTTQGGTIGAGPADWNDRPNSLQTACPRGYHANKSGYYSQKYGWVPAGSACVKNRRRNPLNPRALSRAMSRLSSAKNAAKFLGRVSIRDGGCGCRK